MSEGQGRVKWVVLVLFALASSGLEIIAAALVYLLLGQVTDPGATFELPLIGDPTSLVAGVSDEQMIYLLSASIGVFFVVRGALVVFQQYLQTRVVQNFSAHVSARLTEEYLNMPYAVHLRRNSAELVRNALFNTRRLSKLLGSLVKVSAESLIVVGLVLGMVLITPMVSLVSILVLGPVTMVLLWLVKSRVKAYGRGVNETERVSLSILQEGLAGIRDVKILNAERWFTKSFRTSRTRQARYRITYVTLGEVPRVMVETLLVIMIAGFFALVTARPSFELATLSTVGLFAYVGVRLKPSIQTIISGVNDARHQMPSLTDIAIDLIELSRLGTIEKEGAGGRSSLPTFSDRIDLKHVSYSYDASNMRPALSDVNVTIQRGESIGIVGPTGSGKSTLIDVIAGLLAPTKGTVKVDGMDIHSGDVEAWYRQLGVVSQSIFMMDATVRGNIALGVHEDQVDEAALEEAVRLAQLDDVVAELPEGLETRLGERGTRLSGGQRQRVAIARALYRKPEVLILDEGTASLDNQTEAELVEALRQLQGKITLIIVAHRLSTVRHCDRVWVVEDGVLGETGTFENLLQRHPMFASLRASTGS